MKKNYHFYNGLAFGVIMSLVFLTQNFFFDDTNHFSFIKKIISALISGLIAGFLFGLILGYFNKTNLSKSIARLVLTEGEKIFIQVPANHFIDKEAVGGYLFLTNKRLIFNSKKLNLQNHFLSLNLDEIVSTERYKTYRFINNGLIVKTNSKQSEKFIVNDAEELTRILNKN